MSTIGVASSVRRKARTMASVFASVWPALSARCDDSWIAGPSAIGSVNGMPSSTTSAPAAGSAERIASDVSGSGSPAVRKVTSAARPCAFNAAKRSSIRVVMRAGLLRWRSIGRSSAPLLAQRGHAHVDGAQYQAHERADELHPFLLLQNGADIEQPHPQEIGDISRRDHDQDPADDFLPADHTRAPPRRSR